MSSYDSSTRGSVVAYLAPDNPKDAIERAIDKLLNGGYLSVAGKDAKRDNPLLSVALTPKGFDLLRSMS